MYNLDAPAPRAVLAILWQGGRSRYAAEDEFAALGKTPASAPGLSGSGFGGNALPAFYAALNMLINQGLVFFADGGEGGQLGLTALGAAKYAAMVGLL